MKKIWHYLVAGTILLSVTACGNNPRKTENNMTETNTARNTVTWAGDSVSAVCELDDVRVCWIRDNVQEKLMPISLFPDAGKNLIDSLSLQGGIPSTISTFLVESDGKLILFDTGMGDKNSRLMEGLRSLNVAPEDIKYIYLTHFHGDHIGGMLNDNRKVFPNAEIYASQAEYDGWMAMDDNKKQQAVKTMGAYQEQLHLFAFGDSLPGKVEALDAVGHTPGHTVFQVGKFLIIGDLMHGAALQLSYPDICASFDMDKAAAIKARKYYIQYAKEQGLVMAGMHLPVPAFLK